MDSPHYGPLYCRARARGGQCGHCARQFLFSGPRHLSDYIRVSSQSPSPLHSRPQVFRPLACVTEDWAGPFFFLKPPHAARKLKSSSGGRGGLFLFRMASALLPYCRPQSMPRLPSFAVSAGEVEGSSSTTGVKYIGRWSWHFGRYHRLGGTQYYGVKGDVPLAAPGGLFNQPPRD
ncbi:hypothetical protein GQ53DRAFT_421654 [Thozetella sp. PMI_491]|nr:hypothetical protein GQ53DRAFT_421654 [Thozetella sp. PMI_491]